MTKISMIAVAALAFAAIQTARSAELTDLMPEHAGTAAKVRKPASGDPKAEIAKAYMDIATIMSQARNNDGDVCDLEAYPSTILEALAKSIGANDVSQPQIPADVTKAVGDTLSYRAITGRFDAWNPQLKQLGDALVGTQWWSTPMGVFGSHVRFTVKTVQPVQAKVRNPKTKALEATTEYGGQIEVTVLEFKNDGSGDYENKTYPGFWQIHNRGGVLKMSIKELRSKYKKTKVFRLVRDRDGSWQLQQGKDSGGENDHLNTQFFDQNVSDCSA